MHDKKNFAVIGAGSFGTALSCMIARSTGGCLIYSNEAKVLTEINNKHTNIKYLGNCALPTGVKATEDFAYIMQSDIIVIAVPSFAFEEILNKIKQHNVANDKIILVATKGMCTNPIQLFSDKIESELNNEFGFISGPNMAKEIAEDKFTAFTITSKNIKLAASIAGILQRQNVHISTSTDLATVQIASMVKNVAAIKSGILMASGQGENAKSWLISEALQEIGIISALYGGKEESLKLPAVIGDLVLTCYSNNSRNTSFGIDFHNSGYNKELLNNYPKLVEGINAAKSVNYLIQKHKLKTPMISSVIELIT